MKLILEENNIPHKLYSVDVFDKDIDRELLKLSRTGDVPLLRIDYSAFEKLESAVEYLDYVLGPIFRPFIRTREVTLETHKALEEALSQISFPMLWETQKINGRLTPEAERYLTAEEKFRKLFLAEFTRRNRFLYLKKIEEWNAAKELNNMNRIITAISSIFANMENILASDRNHMWLGGYRMTLEDVKIIILLKHLELLKLSKYFIYDKRNVRDYFDEIKDYRSYRKAFACIDVLPSKSKRLSSTKVYNPSKFKWEYVLFSIFFTFLIAYLSWNYFWY